MSDFMAGLLFIVAGVGAFAAQRFILSRWALREERRDRQIQYLTEAYRAFSYLAARLRPEEDVDVVDPGSMYRDERVEVERAIFDSVLFGDRDVVDGVQAFGAQSVPGTDVDDWNPTELMLVLRKILRREYRLDPLEGDLASYQPRVRGLVGSEPGANDEQARPGTEW